MAPCGHSAQWACAPSRSAKRVQGSTAKSEVSSAEAAHGRAIGLSGPAQGCKVEECRDEDIESFASVPLYVPILCLRGNLKTLHGTWLHSWVGHITREALQARRLRTGAVQ